MKTTKENDRTKGKKEIIPLSSWICDGICFHFDSSHIEMIKKVEKDGLRTITLDDEQVDYMVSRSTQALLEIPNH